MKTLFVSRANQFRTAIETAGAIVPAKSVLQSLECVRITSNGTTITASGFSQSEILSIASFELPNLYESFDILVNAKLLTAICKQFETESTIAVKARNDNQLVIESTTYAVSVTYKNNDNDFPNFDIRLSPLYEVSFDKEQLAELKSFVAFTSDEDFRPAMQGIYFAEDKRKTDNPERKLCIAATDGYKLAYSVRKDKDFTTRHEFIVPKDAIKNIKGNQCTIKFYDVYAVIESELNTTVCKMIDEKYPDIFRIIPNDCHGIVKFKARDLNNAIKSTQITASTSEPMITLSATKHNCCVGGFDDENGLGSEALILCDTQFIVPNDLGQFNIAFNPKHLSAIFNFYKDGEVDMAFITNTKAAIFASANSTMFTLVMPVRMGSEVKRLSEVTYTPPKPPEPTPEETTTAEQTSSEPLSTLDTAMIQFEDYLKDKGSADDDTVIKALTEIANGMPPKVRKEVMDYCTDKKNNIKACTADETAVSVYQFFVGATA